jgi:RluA family pseudouridine synthase
MDFCGSHLFNPGLAARSFSLAGAEVVSLQMVDGYTELSFQYARINSQEESLLEFLLRRFRYYGPKEWEEHIKSGHLLVDGQQGKVGQKLLNNQRVVYLRPDSLEPSVDANYEVLFEDEWLIGLNKPGDLPTSPSGKYFKNTLMHLVRERFGWQKLYTIHRLDRETSGVVLFAKTHQTAQQMATLFRNKQIRKEYRAVVVCPMPEEEVLVSKPIGPDPSSSIRIKQSVCEDGKPSQTRFRQLKTIGKRAYLQIHPMTGRTHQIRVHASASGFPIVGDKLYGLTERDFLRWLEEGEFFLKARNLPNRQLLHAHQIDFVHPQTDQPMCLMASDEEMLLHLPAEEELSH